MEDVCDGFWELGACISSFIYDCRFSRNLFPLSSTDRVLWWYLHGLTRSRQGWCVNLAVVLSIAKCSDLFFDLDDPVVCASSAVSHLVLLARKHS